MYATTCFCIFAVRTYHFVCFVLLRLNCFASLLPKIKSSFPTFPVPPNCLCAPVPLIFRPQFPCSPEINDFVPVFPKTPAWAHHTSMTSWVKQIQLSARSCNGSQYDMITQFPCSPEINDFVPVFPKTPAWAHHTSMTSWVKQIQLSARSCTGPQYDMIT